MRRRFACGLLIAAAAQAHGQAALTHTVSGVVFDSVAGAPLTGAVVQMELADSSHRSFTAVTDTAGRFRITALPSGRFGLGFQHRSLDALGLESPLIALELGADSEMTVDLAIPSGAVVRRARCPKTADDTTVGMLAGFVSDPATGFVVGAVVSVQWMELVKVGKNFETATRATKATVTDQGTYLACDVPSDAWLGVGVAVPRYHVIDGHTAIPPGGATRQDFTLVDSSVMRGSASLAGRVLRMDRIPLASGRAVITALAIDVPIRDGRFMISGLPPGTWDVEARAIGFEPHSVLVQLSDHVVDSTMITITEKAQTLETVSIIGKPSRDLKVLDAMVARSRIANGTLFMPGNLYLRNADVTASVLGGAKGFRVRDATNIYARGCGDSTTNGDVAELRMRRGNRGPRGERVVAVYLDGNRVPTGLPGLNNLVPMNQILAIEAYPDVMSAPFLWRTNDACAVVAVWTKR